MLTVSSSPEIVDVRHAIADSSLCLHGKLWFCNGLWNQEVVAPFLPVSVRSCASRCTLTGNCSEDGRWGPGQGCSMMLCMEWCS